MLKKAGGFLKGAAGFLFFDDIKTLVDPNASLLDKGIAAFSLLPVGKIFKGVKLGFNLLSKSKLLDKAADGLNKVKDKVKDAAEAVAEKTSKALKSGWNGIKSGWKKLFGKGKKNKSKDVKEKAEESAKDKGKKIHGNSLDTPKPTDLYVVREKRTGEIIRFGETTQGYKKRGQQHARRFSKLGIEVETTLLKGGLSKREAKALETRYIRSYEKVFGNKPPYNKSYH